MNPQKLILKIDMEDGTFIKVMPISNIIDQMNEIEYKTDELYGFEKFPDEAYKSMWLLLKQITKENLVDDN